MTVNPENAVSIAEVGRDFSRVARLADEKGAVVILKDGGPRYILMEYSQAEPEQPAPDEEVFAVSRRLIDQNQRAYEELAK